MLRDRREGKRREFGQFAGRALLANAGSDEQAALGMRERAQRFVEFGLGDGGQP